MFWHNAHALCVSARALWDAARLGRYLFAFGARETDDSEVRGRGAFAFGRWFSHHTMGNGWGEMDEVFCKSQSDSGVGRGERGVQYTKD